jgi:hypothetical protein
VYQPILHFRFFFSLTLTTLPGLDPEASSMDACEVNTQFVSPESCWKEVREVFQTQLKRRSRRLVLLVQSIAGKQRVIEELGAGLMESVPCVELAAGRRFFESTQLDLFISHTRP